MFNHAPAPAAAFEAARGAVRAVRGALPDGEPVDLFADGDRWTTEPVRGAELVAEGWLLPGLVDAHTHPGAEEPGRPLDDDVLRADLRAHVAAGVAVIRAPGLAGEPPGWFGHDEDGPRAVHAGPWIAQPGQSLPTPAPTSACSTSRGPSSSAAG